MKGLVTWLAPQHVLPASHTHCECMAKHHENKDEHQHDARCSINPHQNLSRLVAGLQQHATSLAGPRAIESRVHAPAQHQTTTSQSCTVPHLQHSRAEDVDSPRE